uniref:Uncharacterized protein n=1 Tax=Glossina brevipalpis TaxID=37001 RepID=A0A1A9W1G5_9MUSC
MLKYWFILSAIIALAMLPRQEVNAFKVIAIHQGPPPSARPGPAAPAFDPNALLQGVSSAVSGQLQQVQDLVGGLVQQKQALLGSLVQQKQALLGGLLEQKRAFAQNALNSIQSMMPAHSQPPALPPPPFVIYKHVYLGRPIPPPSKPDKNEQCYI